MPRGIYDRTKTKAQRTVEKVNKPVTPTKKKTKKTDKLPEVINLVPSIDKGNSFPDDIYLMSEARANLDVLNRVAEKFANVSEVDEEISAHIQILARLSKKVFSSIQEEQESNSDSSEPSNGVTVVSTTIPLPSVPPIVIPVR